MTGNLHFEPVMLFFLIWGLYQLHQQKWIFSAILIACSVSVKLIPLLFLPLFFQWFTKPNTYINQSNKMIWKGFKVVPKNFIKLVLFYLIILLTITLLFLPFYSSELISNYSNSVGLWFGKFEFNASVFYIFREIGFYIRGYNEISIISKITLIATVIFLFKMTFQRQNKTVIQLITAMLFVLSFYYFTSTTIHPWYLATPIILSVFTKYKFPIVWSFVIILSYQAYSNLPWKENLWFVALEYFIVFGYLIYELKKTIVKKMIN